jgi:hypothetical protein
MPKVEVSVFESILSVAKEAKTLEICKEIRATEAREYEERQRSRMRAKREIETEGEGEKPKPKGEKPKGEAK